MFRDMASRLADFLFPPFCVACNRSGEWWCAACRGSVQRMTGNICPRCLTVVSRQSSVDSHRCEGGLPFAAVKSLGYYHDPKLRAVITSLKFNGTSVLADDLKSFIRLFRPEDLPDDAVLVPMPLATKRLKERGFNQAEIIASAFRDVWWPQTRISDCLQRIGHRDPQSSLENDAAARRANVGGVFACPDVAPTKVVLVDDVVTTGATADEAAKVLLAAGAREIRLLTLAIGA